jgi:hypothetical protein
MKLALLLFVYATTSFGQEVAGFTEKVKQGIAEQKLLEVDPDARAKLYYQEDVDAKACSHCPKYLDLISQVNKIVEKSKDGSIKSENDKLIALTKLKFLYYTVKTTYDNHFFLCKSYSQMSASEELEYQKGSMNLAVEQALALPNIKDVQLYEGEGKEVHYYYQGEGIESDNVIEVVMFPNGESKIKYYKYERKNDLPSFVANFSKAIVAPIQVNNDNLKTFSSDETNNFALPADSNVSSKGTTIALTNTLNLKNTNDFSTDKKKVNISFEDNEGKKYVEMVGTGNISGEKVVDAVVNYDIELNKDSGLKIGSSIGNNLETTGNLADGIINKQSVKLGLTDHNNEYATLRTYMDSDGVLGVEVGNKFKAGTGSIANDVQLSRDGTKTYKVDVLDQGYLSNASFSYKESGLTGDRSFGASAGIKVDSSLRLKTDYSQSKIEGQSIAVGFEKAISKTTSMVLAVSQGDKAGYSVLYQLQTKF